MPSANAPFAGIVAGAVFLLGGAGASRGAAGAPATPLAKITIDYPLDGSVFPPEITPPTFLWRDDSESARRWVVEVSFAGRSDGVRVEAPGEHLQRGEIDPRLGASSELPPLTPQQAATRTWKPDAESWAKIKRWSVRSPASVVITGFAADDAQGLPVSSGRVTLSTSLDGVGAPVLYRDVPRIDPQATEVYRSLNRAYELVGNNQVAEAVQELRKAVEQEPDDGLVHYALAMQLSRSPRRSRALPTRGRHEHVALKGNT